ncbi:SMEK domain-containing protein [Sinomonas sp. P47F7]|uniref:SMEK domain-containing protein n=1 Tax=Sinomonas sp. P47F7 TaxID=3410987 RepID=UPI003BF617B2
MDEIVVKERIVDRMSILESHVSGRVAHGLTDVTSALEVLYREVLNLTRGWNLASTNFPSRNFPAVDLHDVGRRVAVQVTATCDNKKIVQTQDTFTRHGLSARYDSLIFVGVKSVKSPKQLAPWAQLFTQSQLLNLENLDLAQLWALDDRLAKSISWDRFTQESDRHCFDVVLGVLDRDAIRHMTQVEGNFGDMLDALRQIKQVINEGRVKGTRIQAKALSLYDTPYVQILEDIDTHVGRMASIVKRNLEPYNFLPHSAAAEVDQERLELVEEVNKFCAAHGHDRRIHTWTGR